MSRRLTLLTSAVVSLSLLVGACSDDDDGSDGNEDGAPVESRVQSLLLDQTDLPEVYSTSPLAEEVDDACGGAGLEIGEPTDTASVAYTAADDGTTLHETVSEYAAGEAAAILEAVRTSPAACVGEEEVPLEVQPLELPTFLDESAAVVASGQVGDQTFTFHQVFLRDGDTLVVLVHGGSAVVDAAATEDLARRAADKVSPPEDAPAS